MSTSWMTWSSALFLFMDVNEHVAIDCIIDAGAVDLARLKHYVAIRQDHWLAPLADVLNHVQRVGIKARGKGIINQKTGDGQQAWVQRIFDPVALQGPEVIGIAEFGAHLLEKLPI